MNKINTRESGFRMRTKNLAVFGINLCIARPIASGISKPIAMLEILAYGTPSSARSKIVLPRVNIQRGIIAKAARVEMVVIAIDRLMFPPSNKVHLIK